ncbi:siderophore-interacting protein [Iamia majanohamensis]|uniref:Siderophore-interacting protein n=1 Tax=Iamia majanohamensis TaxID=467976 RepID=A0AAE9YAE5_9ACTN|nr:siderophore-interacting protein [Iamia majanohamensis]WCO68791.1 siderophore-interacting protein [Iamia majanohamensis]
MPDPQPTYGTVETVERLTPSMARVVMGGDGLAAFAATDRTDQYVNALFLPDGAPHVPPFDPDAARAGDAAHRPRGRRYTVRAWDAEHRRLTIDLVVHGDHGYAGRWAQRARPGDRLQVVGPSGGYRPDPGADWHLLAGDESALPAIAASLEVMPAHAEGVVVVVVDGPGHEYPLAGPDGLDVRWLHRSGSDAPADLLPAAVADLAWRPGTPQVFVHGEAAEVRATRRHLLGARGVPKEGASISPYWRRGHTDEAWREVKRDWIAAQAADV